MYKNTRTCGIIVLQTRSYDVSCHVKCSLDGSDVLEYSHFTLIIICSYFVFD